MENFKTKDEEQSKSLVPDEDGDNVDVKNEDSCIARCHYFCWNSWLNICRKINTFFEKQFAKLGCFIALHPLIVLILGVIIPLVLTVGFVRFHTVTRVEELYIPQSSQAIKHIERGNIYFPLKLKAEEFIIKKKDNGGVLEDDIFLTVLDIHRHIMAIQGLHEICAKNVYGFCYSQTPLEIFQFNETKMKNVRNTLNKVYQNDSVLLSNYRPAKMSYSEYFGYFEYDYAKKEIKKAEAIRSMYFVQFPDDSEIHLKEYAWEEKYIAYMSKTEKTLQAQGLELLYSAGKSLDDSVSESAAKDVNLVPIALLLMVMFCTITLARFGHPVIGHFHLGNGGVATLALGIGAAFGFVMLTGHPYVAFAGVLPFLVLGVGIDNMFIITDCLDRQDPDLRGHERISKALGHIGASITMTTLTDLVAFSVSMVTDFPAIKYFCLYAALCITFCYLLVITLFLALLTYDVNRIEARRRDFLPCLFSNQNDEQDWTRSHDSISRKVMTTYATYLMKAPIKYTMFALSLVLLLLGILGSVRIDQSFDMLVLGLDDSAYDKFYGYRNKAYRTGFEISVIIDTPINYTHPDVQRNYAELSNIPIDNKYMKNHTINWMSNFLMWTVDKNISSVGSNFHTSLRQFLNHEKKFLPDIKFDKKGEIIASRILMFNKDNPHSIFRKDTMLSLRQDLKNKSNIPAYPINLMFIYIEQFVIILRDTIRNLGICAGAILLITLPYLMHPVITFLVFFGFISLIFELFGLMFLWNVSLNSISMIVIVMAIGFAVDYSAHVAHAFMISKADTPEERVIEALKTMGASVLMGGTSTFIGVVVTAFSSSEIFKIFFKMVFGIVILGLLHGLVFLPVLLSIFCRTDLRIALSADDSGPIAKKANGSQPNLELQPNGVAA